MAAERFFTKIANDVLQASEQIATRMEEGLGVVFGGESSTRPSQQEDTVPGTPSDDMEDLLMGNPLQGMAESVLKGIMEGQGTGPQTFREHLDAFRSAITWEEPFIIGLVCFQILMFAVAIYVSRNNFALGPRITVMVVIGLIVRSSEYTNQWASTNWRLFATQNYFDSRGIFMSGMVCGPLLMDTLIMLFCFLREAAQLLVQVKTMKMKQSAMRKQQVGSKKKDQ